MVVSKLRDPHEIPLSTRTPTSDIGSLGFRV